MTGPEAKNLRELEAALGLLKLGGFQTNRYCAGKQVRKTRLQTSVLSKVFEISRFPSSKTILDLALLINIHPKSVQKWFQNTRQTMRKKGCGKAALAQLEPDEYNVIDIPLGVLADMVETERQGVPRLDPE